MPWAVVADSEGWALGEIAACDGLGAERVEAMARLKTTMVLFEAGAPV